MSTYRAVVKYAVDATPEQRARALVEGIEECAVELLEQCGKDLDFIDRTLDDARSTCEHELELRREREELAADREDPR